MRLESFGLLHLTGICVLGLITLMSCTLHG